jgi:methionyl aminopeptidase
MQKPIPLHLYFQSQTYENYMFKKKSGILIKTPEQIEGVRKSAQLAAKTLHYLGEFAKPGITTAFIDKKCAEYMKDHGAVSATKGFHGYPAHCCTSVNDVICHGIPGPYELKEGDILNIDVTPILNGFFGDTSRMYGIGEISQQAQHLIDITKNCLWEGIREVRPENKFGNIGYKIARLAHEHKYSVVFEFTGHGVGVDFHEPPQIDHIAEKNSGATMQAGMIFTIEPMINQGKARAKVDKKDGWTARTIDGKLSAQFEHTVLVTETGFEVLTDVFGEF